MARTISRGTCAACGKVVAKNQMARHLGDCPQTIERAGQSPTGRGKLRATTLIQLQINAPYRPDYWLYVEVPADATLRHLDTFLRNIWLECCGHLSSFNIDGMNYDVVFEQEFGGRSMNAKIGSLLSPGVTAEYVYDFGTSTNLSIRSLSSRPGMAKSNIPTLLARNVAPAIPCAICGEPATQTCSECNYEDAGWLCDEHAQVHECGADMFLPIVNSPRTGQCGYIG